MATQEDAIMEFAKRLAGTGTVVGVSQKDILALSAAMSSVGISAESGGSAMSKVLTKMNNAVQNGGKELQGFASIAGKSGAEFAQIWKSDPYRAVQLFEEGLAKQNKQGHNVKAMLKELGITELRETDTVLRLANGNEQLALARDNANKGWSKGNALSKEAETKYKTLGNQMKIFMNHIRDLGMELGATLAPVLIGIMKVLTPMIDALAKAPTPVKGLVIALALIPVAAVPVLASLAAITGSMGLVGQAMNTASKGAMANSRSMRIYATSMSLLTNPIKTTGSALQSLAGRMRGTGKASKVLKNDMVASSGGMVTAGKNAGTAGGFFSKFGGKLKWVASMGGLLTPIISGLGAVIAAIGAPILIAVGAIAALVGAFVLAYKKVGWFRKGIDGLVYTFKVFGGGIINSVGNSLKWLGEKFGWLSGTAVKKSTFALQVWYKSLPNTSKLKQAVAGLSMLKSGFKSVMGVLASAKDKATDVSDALGKGVSKGTKQALGNFVKYSADSDKILAQIKNNHGEITEKERLALNQIQDKMTADLMDKLNQRAKKQKAIQQKVFAENSGLSAKREQEIMQKTTEQFETSKERLKQISAEIKRLVDKQARDGKLDAKEMQELNKLYDKQRELAVGTLSSTTKEQDRILSQMSINRKAYNMQEAQDIIQGGIKARDAAKAEAKKRYDQEVDNINQMVGLSEEEKQKMLANAKSRYDEEVQKANNKHQEIVSGVKKNNKNIEKEMDLSSGRVYSNAEKWWNDIARTSKETFDRGWNTGKTIYSIIDVFGKTAADKLYTAGESFKQSGAHLWSKVKEGWDSAIQTTGDIWNSIQTKGENIGTWFSQKGSEFWYNTKTAWNNAVATTGDFWTGIKTTSGNIGVWFAQKGYDLWKSLKTGWDLSLVGAGALWTSLTTWLGTTFGNIGFWFVQKGANLWKSIKQGWDLSVAGAGSLWTIFIGKLGATWEGIRMWFVSKGSAMGQGIITGWNLVSGKVISVLTSMWNTAKFIWNSVWIFIKTIAGYIGNYILNRWNFISKITFTTWSFIKNTVGTLFGGTWTVIRDISGWIWGRIKNVWNWIKEHIWKRLSNILGNVRDVFAKMWESIRYRMSIIWNNIRNGWNNIKNYIGDMANRAKNAVVNKFRDMYNGAKKWVDNIGSYIDNAKSWMKSKALKLGKSVANGAISGLNKMIGGINKISKAITDKNLMKTIPSLSTGTTAPNGVPVNRDGQLKQSTAAIVNDKGPGNGTGARGYQELIQRKNGDIQAPKGRNVLVGLNKGDSVINGRHTQELRKRGMIPKFSTGTFRGKSANLSNLPHFSEGSKKKKNLFEKIGDGLKGAVGGFKDKTRNTAHNIKEGASGIMEEVGDKVKDAASWLGNKIGDAWDYVENPGKLVSKMMESLGISFGKSNKTMEMAGLAYNKLKKMLVDKVKSWFEEYGGGGDGGYLFDYPVWQRFGSYTGGLSFNGGRHYGMDFGMPTGTPIYAVKGGVVDRTWYDYGGGNSIQVKTGPGEWNWYMHLSKILAKQGQRVAAGKLIGKSGETGNYVRGAHLHFQLMRGSHPGNDTAKDPEKWLKSLKGSGGGGSWGSKIRQAAARMGTRVSGSDVSDISRLIQTESSGNEGIIQQIVDINTGANRARGLLQYTPGTFSSYKVRGAGNIMNGMHQLMAFFNNSNWRSDLSAWKRRMASGSTGWGPTGSRRRYAHGGLIKKHGLYEAGEGNRPEMVLPLTNKTRTMQLIEKAKRMAGIKDPEIEYDKEININNNNSNNSSSNQLLQQLIQAQEHTNILLAQLLTSNQNIENKSWVFDEDSIKKLHNKHQDERERKAKRADMYRGGRTI